MFAPHGPRTALRRFGAYRLDRLIGRGSVGEVWLAHDTAADRTVALKILSVTAAEDPDYRRRFEREARIGANLDDPHIVPIHGFGEQDGRLFLDMAHIPGVDVSARLRVGPLGVPAAVDLVAQVARALDAAHAAGLIHRDVKPGNIILHPSGFAYLIDFGIARAPNQTTITATGFTVGTLAYMAPERFTGHGDARADIYALACVLYECLTALRPFGDTDPVRQLHAHLNEAPPSAHSIDPSVPPALDAVIARGMAKNPEDRYPSAGALAAAALAAAGMTQPIPRTPPILDGSSARPTRTLSAESPAPTRQLPPQAPVPPAHRQASEPRLPTRQFPAESPSPTKPLSGPPAVVPGRASAAQPRPTLVATRLADAGRVETAAAEPDSARRAFPMRVVAAAVAAAIAVFAAIAMVVTLVTSGGGGQRHPARTPSATVAPTGDRPAPAQHTTAPPQNPLTIPVPPGFDNTAPFQIPTGGLQIPAPAFHDHPRKPHEVKHTEQ
ncbi:serine/threonine-protein kinase [Nocardia terpenica]|uniref:non-specific serine/threonine protein kinase n=1 Tax=Nocardia terpenica TaxID=455432 RepID=A0A6G9YXX8_9NOCA|nr:serine/threonine-protein kinase [Nocardia terpenica]QIS17961.1 protein kinase [Nocardia terpenica]